MSAFENAFQRLIVVEGGWANNKNDRGGKTMYGVTEAVARAYGYKGAMPDLPIGLAQKIFKTEYWDKLQLDTISRTSVKVAEELFDTGVNCGVGTAAKFLQRGLNAFNQQGKLYIDLPVTGTVGQMTLTALGGYFQKRGALAEIVLLRALNAMQGEYYIDIGVSRPENEDFEFGWFSARIVI